MMSGGEPCTEGATPGRVLLLLVSSMIHLPQQFARAGMGTGDMSATLVSRS